VLTRLVVIRTAARHGLTVSFAPLTIPGSIGNGCHIHFSAAADGQNVFAGGDGRYGMTHAGEAMIGGVVAHLQEAAGLFTPSVISYARLVPGLWAGAYACWGLENREAAMRMVTGSRGSEDWAANLEVKCVDLHANPYLLLAGLLATGTAGLEAGTPLPDPVDVDPAALSEETLAGRGIRRLPGSLREALDAFTADSVLGAALGAPLAGAIRAVRESELELFDGASPEEIAAASRWAH